MKGSFFFNSFKRLRYCLSNRILFIKDLSQPNILSPIVDYKVLKIYLLLILQHPHVRSPMDVWCLEDIR